MSFRPITIAFVSQTGNVMKTTLAAAMAVELVKAGVMTLAIDLDVEHRSLTLWGEDRKAQHPGREPVTVVPATSAEAALTLAGSAAGYQVAIIDCPSRASEATLAIAEAADLVVLPIVPGRKDVLLTAITISTLLRVGVKVESLALVLTRMLTEPEVRDHKSWLGNFMRGHDPVDLMVIEAALFEKPAYRIAVSRGLAITEVAPVSLRKTARAAVDELIGLAMQRADAATSHNHERGASA